MIKLNQIVAAAFLSLTINSFANDCPALSGTYSIGKNEGADFASVNEAVSAMECGGVSGPVTFKMESGIYLEKVVMSSIPGASVINEISFESRTGNNTDVIIAFPTSDATVTMNGTSFVSFQNISIDHNSATYGNAMRVDGKANYLQFRSVIFTGVDVARTGANSATVYFTTNAPKTNILIEDCEITNGSIGLYKGGVNADEKDSKTNISGTLFYNQFEAALALSNEDAPMINNNVISSLSTYIGFRGMSFENVSNELNINGNIVSLATSATGLALINCSGDATHLGQINSNSIAVGGKNSACGIQLSGSTDNQVFNYNRIKLDNTTSTADQAYYMNSGSGNNVNLMNNIFYDLKAGNYTILGNSYKDMFNQLPGQGNADLAVSANGIMVEKVSTIR